ncbi:MAG: GTP pyrophosphokinase family protein [Oscillospiraceae bacterium]|nr:GTP pyrophosphokinase family protein [Oscillospiraceae bacterium]
MIDEKYSINELVDIAEGSDLEKIMKKFSTRMQLYSGGIKEIRTKLEILDEEFKSKFSYNPIHNIESRLKSMSSIVQKIKSKGLEISIDSITENITDIAGIRVICNYIDDIYRVAEMLTVQDDITVLQMRDYIKNPKSSGYKSLHLIVEVPVFLSTGPVPMPVEIQIRTIAMDFWASLEHKLKYKNSNMVDDDLHERLKKCADEISAIDYEMQDIHNTINSRNKSE